MAEIVSLNQYRKARERAKAKSEAAENRVLHGRSKAERSHDAAEKDRQTESHEENRLDRRDSPPETD